MLILIFYSNCIHDCYIIVNIFNIFFSPRLYLKIVSTAAHDFPVSGEILYRNFMFSLIKKSMPEGKKLFFSAIPRLPQG